MEFLTVRELTASPREAWEKLARDGEVAITNNGKPAAIMVDVSDCGFDETVRLIRQAKSMRLLNRIWAEAEARGPLDEVEVEAEIRAARAEQAQRTNRTGSFLMPPNPVEPSSSPEIKNTTPRNPL
jgi:PHD/YefM family antitoxin component YafN of YafNO toxin-antitoxin module